MDTIPSDAGGVFGHDANWLHQGNGLGGSTVVVPNYANGNLEDINGVAIHPIPPNWPARMNFAIVRGGQIASYHEDQPEQ